MLLSESFLIGILRLIDLIPWPTPAKKKRGRPYVYAPVVTRDKARRSAVKHMLDTYFSGSPEEIMAALLDVSSTKLTTEELDRMAEMIHKARREGK